MSIDNRLLRVPRSDETAKDILADGRRFLERHHWHTLKPLTDEFDRTAKNESMFHWSILRPYIIVDSCNFWLISPSVCFDLYGYFRRWNPNSSVDDFDKFWLVDVTSCFLDIKVPEDPKEARRFLRGKQMYSRYLNFYGQFLEKEIGEAQVITVTPEEKPKGKKEKKVCGAKLNQRPGYRYMYIPCWTFFSV